MTFYGNNHLDYIDKTKDINMDEIYKFVLKYLKPKSKILDIGFGSARDMLYFKSNGFIMSGIDNEPSFVKEALKKGLDVSCMDILDVKDTDMYDALFANASLLHISKDKLNDAFIICNNLLKDNGIMYCSFKYGDFEGYIDDRYFIYLTEQSIKEYLSYTSLKVLDIKITDDNMGRDNKWLNVILVKK